MLPRFYYRFRIKYVLVAVFFVYLLEYMGTFTHIFEQEFNEQDFDWPLHADVHSLAAQRRRGQPTDTAPINVYNYTFLKSCSTKCRTSDGALLSTRLVYVVKSAMRNFARRQAIRNTWGFERRLSDVVIRTVFVLGVAGPDVDEPRALQHAVDVESGQFEDIVQANFEDTYFNNTIKMMTGLRWAIEHCPRSQFYMFVDDDYYVSTKNVLRFVRNPLNYPEYLEEAEETLRKLARRLRQSDLPANQSAPIAAEARQVVESNVRGSETQEHKEYLNDIRKFVNQKDKREAEVAPGRHLMEMELAENARLFSGFVFRSAPHRHRSSKWYVSLDEYPWHMWPPYVTAGAFVLSREALIQIYYASMFTKHFRFDDIYLGIVALKAGIEPLHCEEFYFHRAEFHGTHSNRYLIASHGYGDPDELSRVWSVSRAAGNA